MDEYGQKNEGTEQNANPEPASMPFTYGLKPLVSFPSEQIINNQKKTTIRWSFFD